MLGLQGKLDESRKVLAGIRSLDTDKATSICITATKGLIDFRSGDVESGRTLYDRAIEAAIQEGNQRLAFRACSNLIFEIANCGDELTENDIKRFSSLGKGAAKEDVSEIEQRLKQLGSQQERGGKSTLAQIEKFGSDFQLS